MGGLDLSGFGWRYQCAATLQAAAAVHIDAIANELPCADRGWSRRLRFGNGDAGTRMAGLRGAAVTVLCARVVAELRFAQAAQRHGSGRFRRGKWADLLGAGCWAGLRRRSGRQLLPVGACFEAQYSDQYAAEKR